MSKASNIKSLAALRERREEIAAEQQAAKKGLTSTLAQAPAKAKVYALEDLALPALGIGLAVYVGYRVLRPRKSSGGGEVEPSVYREAPPTTAYSAPAPRSGERPQSAPAPSRQYVAPVKKSPFSISALISAGKILVPAVQAIIGVVQNQQVTPGVEQAVE